MARSEVPDEVGGFVTSHIHTLGDLQALIALVDGGHRWWDARSLANELGISESTARATLERFASNNLLDIRLTGSVRYQFRPGTQELRAAVTACAHLYRDNPLALIRLLSPSGRQSVWELRSG